LTFKKPNIVQPNTM